MKKDITNFQRLAKLENQKHMFADKFNIVCQELLRVKEKYYENYMLNSNIVLIDDLNQEKFYNYFNEVFCDLDPIYYDAFYLGFLEDAYIEFGVSFFEEMKIYIDRNHRYVKRFSE